MLNSPPLWPTSLIFAHPGQPFTGSHSTSAAWRWSAMRPLGGCASLQSFTSTSWGLIWHLPQRPRPCACCTDPRRSAARRESRACGTGLDSSHGIGCHFSDALMAGGHPNPWIREAAPVMGFASPSAHEVDASTHARLPSPASVPSMSFCRLRRLAPRSTLLAVKPATPVGFLWSPGGSPPMAWVTVAGFLPS